MSLDKIEKELNENLDPIDKIFKYPSKKQKKVKLKKFSLVEFDTEGLDKKTELNKLTDQMANLIRSKNKLNEDYERLLDTKPKIMPKCREMDDKIKKTFYIKFI